jgi:8-oxo-dGTP pyrophosphatase MutT (NUDIX family)
MRAWQLLHSEPVVDRPWIRIHEQHLRLPSGVEIDPFHLVEAPDWVAILALTPEGQVVMVEQYRHGAGRTSRELPAGMIDDGESASDAARRELLEETGYAVDEPRLIQCVQTEPTRHTNRAHFFFAPGARRVAEPRREATEDIEVSLLPVAELLAAVEQNQLIHGLHVGAILLAERRGWLER